MDSQDCPKALLWLLSLPAAVVAVVICIVLYLFVEWIRNSRH